MSNSVLITGSSGYIGSNLVAFLKQLDDWEIIEVNRSAGYDLSVAGWSKQLPDREVDYIVHLAQSNQYRDFPKGSWDMLQVNVSSTLELLEWSRLHCVKRFLFASTGNVYKPSSSLLVETDKCQPNSMYAASKLSGEHFVQQYSEFFETVVMRIFGVYGAGQENMTISHLVNKIKTNQEISLASGAGLYFTPLYIDDCIGMISTLLKYSFKVNQNIVNLAGNEVVTLADVITIIQEGIKRVPQVRFTDDDPVYLQGNNNKIKSITKINDLMGVKQGILEMISVEW